MNETKKYWLNAMIQIANPVLNALAQDRLKIEMPIECPSGCAEHLQDYAQHTYLEAFGRTLLGFTPWLEAPTDDIMEQASQEHYKELIRKAIHNAVTPTSRDYMNFSEGYQPIVDAAFLAQAILRAPKSLWEELPKTDKQNLIAQMKRTRTRKPWRNNWLLFSAMIETFLWYAGQEDWDSMRIDYALHTHENWYKGGGFYGDGEEFHMDYYNSYVIQPMLTDILRLMQDKDPNWAKLYEQQKKRGMQYAAFLERVIMPDGSYPILGRSSSYRFGCFQMLSQAALLDMLPSFITPAQVRCGLTAVLQKILSYDNFDENGWLKIGVCGSQPDMGESYISTGSLYLCTAIFLPLGLPDTHPFWSDPDVPWSMKKLYTPAARRPGCPG